MDPDPAPAPAPPHYGQMFAGQDESSRTGNPKVLQGVTKRCMAP